MTSHTQINNDQESGYSYRKKIHKDSIRKSLEAQLRSISTSKVETKNEFLESKKEHLMNSFEAWVDEVILLETAK